ncbi:DUF3306 domain-containing protein [Azohydromonas lata]|uniref:DUF3306 domain-containing protein n=1 Tax=Azohydromonas lata TaxID=45677 RepID=UPI0008297AB8|nr:DUF3306 domain-containing protein [Azohydromonas lata]
MADDGFFSRWSRRKAQVTRGEPPAEPAPLAAPPVAPAATVPAQPAAEVQPPADVKPAAPPPTLEDVSNLGRESDYSRFVARDVAPDVKNAALRKLFSDPHFNVMDGLDIYIDDYNKPDPLPPGMLRQLAQSKMLGLFDDEEEDQGQDQKPPQDTPAGTAAGLAESAAEPAPDAPVADAAPAAPGALPADDPAPPPLTTNTATDEDPDLQLQPHHAAGRRGPGPGPAAG